MSDSGDDFDVFDDDEVMAIFQEIVGMEPADDDAPSSGDGDGSDESCAVYLLDGTVMRFNGISAYNLASALLTHASVVMYDASGKSCALFSQGVTAIVGSKA